MKTIFVAAALTLAAVPAFAGEGNGDPFALRTSPIASTTVAEVRPDTGMRPDTGTENTPNLNAAFARPDEWTALAAGADETPVQRDNSLPAGALDGNFAHAQVARRSLAAR